MPPGAPTAPTRAVPPPPPPLQSRTGRVIKWGVAALLIAALGLGSWQLADTLLGRNNAGSGGNGSNQTQPKNNDTPQQPDPGKSLAIKHASVLGNSVKPETADKTIDGDPAPGWITPRYVNYAKFGNLETANDGSGIIVDLGSVQNVSGIDVDMWVAGQTAEVLAAPPEAANPGSVSAFTQPIVKLGRTEGKLQTTLDAPIRTRYVLIHITELPSEGTGGYRGGINEIKVLGQAG